MNLLEDPNLEENRKIELINDKFRGLLIEVFNHDLRYYGWRPAHALDGEVVMKEFDPFATAKKLVHQISITNTTYIREILTDDIVAVFLQRDKIAENSLGTENEQNEDKLLGIMKVQTRYSPLILDILHNREDKDVKNALDLLITLNEEVKTTLHKARTFQQIAWMFAYEIGINDISKEIVQLVKRVNRIVHEDHSSIILPAKRFDIAHKVIDEAINQQPSHLHHLVTKATFYRHKHNHLYDNTGRDSPETEDLKLVIEEAISTTRKGIDLCESALKDKNCDSYLYGMIGKIQIIVVFVIMFKKLPFFAQHPDGQDKSFKRYVNFKKIWMN